MTDGDWEQRARAGLVRVRERELKPYGEDDDLPSEVSIMKVGTLKMQFDGRHRGYVAKSLAALLLAGAVALIIVALRYR